MRIKNIYLENFKKLVGSHEYHPDGESVSVTGENRIGKTSAFADSVSWLLFNKDSEGSASPELTPIIDNEPQNHLETVVEVVFILDDEKEVILKKIYKAMFGQKGKKKGQLLGHTTDHYINGDYIEKKADYDLAVAEIANPKTFRLLTDPMYFNNPDPKVMPWKDRRNIVLQMAGVSEEEIKANDTRVKTLKKSKGDLDKKLQGKADGIKGARANLPDEQASKANDVPLLRKQLQELQDKRNLIANGGDVPLLKKQIAEAEAELLETKNQQREKIQGQIEEAQFECGKKANTIGEIEAQISTKRRQSASVLEEIQVIIEKQARLKEEYEGVKKGEYESSICPILEEPCDRINSEDAKDKYNQAKSEILEKMADQAKVNKSRHAELKEQDNQLTQEINELNAKLPALREKETEHKNKIAELQNIKVETLPEYQEIEKKVEDLKTKVEAANQSIDTTEIDQEIKQVQAQITEAEGIQAAIAQREKSIAGIKAMEDEHSKMAAELVKVETELLDLEQKILNQARALEDKIDVMFEFIGYQMFETSLDGEVTECCRCKNKEGVDISNFSTSETIRAGLDFIRRYSAFTGISMPVIVDRRESIELLPDMNGTQIISLYHQPGVKEIKMEKEG